MPPYLELRLQLTQLSRTNGHSINVLPQHTRLRREFWPVHARALSQTEFTSSNELKSSGADPILKTHTL